MDSRNERRNEGREEILIGVVGPCGAGKSTLVAGLSDLGFRARGIAQEHSFAPSMWQRITKPDILIYLDVSYENTIRRRKLDWTLKEYAEQLYRLRHAREHADLYIDTNPLTILEVLKRVVNFLEINDARSNSI
jgi:deoxyadenosine/deoxycytidine kinase